MKDSPIYLYIFPSKILFTRFSSDNAIQFLAFVAAVTHVHLIVKETEGGFGPFEHVSELQYLHTFVVSSYQISE